MANIVYFQSAYKQHRQKEFMDHAAKARGARTIKNLTMNNTSGSAIFF